MDEVTDLKSLLEELGLKQYYKNKISLSSILEINKKIISDEPAKCNSDLPWYFLKKIMMFNVTSLNVKCTSDCESNSDHELESKDTDLDNMTDSLTTDYLVNPLDIITALFLCSDGFLQQEMALKMSMCQFSVPLLLPNCDTEQCTLMLWAMRDVVKKYRPQSLSQSKGFIEERIVLSELPMVSFVRLGECSLSKSEILNKLLSNDQQYHDTFVHHNMECGDSPRRISNGLTEITWYLPGGNKNIDIFSQPVAVANLRGDIASFETQYAFLCQTSAAVFVFFDHLDSESVFNLLKSQNHKAQIFLVGNCESKSFNLDAVKKVANKLGFTKHNIIFKTNKKNDADFVKDLRKKVRNVVEKSELKMKIEKMVDVADELGILVDEDSPECQTAKKNAEAITSEIQDIYKYKEDQLPRQGQILKDLACLEKEEFRLRNYGSNNIEDYKSNLQKHKEELRKKQNSYKISIAMTNFITGISSPGTERFYFLKWMRMNLDNVSRIKLSELREKYKDKCKNSENKEEIKEIDRQISNSSLGTEHFFREMGQIYEASLSLPETDRSHQQLQHLPKLCAELLLDGFPLELVDGDASNIPLRWVSDVLSQLNDLVSPKKDLESSGNNSGLSNSNSLSPDNNSVSLQMNSVSNKDLVCPDNEMASIHIKSMSNNDSVPPENKYVSADNDSVSLHMNSGSKNDSAPSDNNFVSLNIKSVSNNDSAYPENKSVPPANDSISPHNDIASLDMKSVSNNGSVTPSNDSFCLDLNPVSNIDSAPPDNDSLPRNNDLAPPDINSASKNNLTSPDNNSVSLYMNTVSKNDSAPPEKGIVSLDNDSVSPDTGIASLNMNSVSNNDSVALENNSAPPDNDLVSLNINSVSNNDSASPENPLVPPDNNLMSPDNDSASLDMNLVSNNGSVAPDNDLVSLNFNSVSNNDSASQENDLGPPENYSVTPDNVSASLDIKSVSKNNLTPPDNDSVSLYVNTVSKNDSVASENNSAPPDNDLVSLNINSVSNNDSASPENPLVPPDNNLMSPDNDSASLDMNLVSNNGSVAPDNDLVSLNFNSVSNNDSASPENDLLPPENYSVTPDNVSASLDIKSVSKNNLTPPDNDSVSLYMNTVSKNDSVAPENNSAPPDNDLVSLNINSVSKNDSASPENDSVPPDYDFVPPENVSASLDFNSASKNNLTSPENNSVSLYMNTVSKNDSAPPKNGIVSVDNDSMSPDNGIASLDMNLASNNGSVAPDNDSVFLNINSVSNNDSASQENDLGPPENYSVTPDNVSASLDIKSVSKNNLTPPDNDSVSLYVNTVSKNDSVAPENNSAPPDNDLVSLNINSVSNNDSASPENNSSPLDNDPASLDINSVSNNDSASPDNDPVSLNFNSVSNNDSASPENPLVPPDKNLMSPYNVSASLDINSVSNNDSAPPNKDPVSLNINSVSNSDSASPENDLVPRHYDSVLSNNDLVSLYMNTVSKNDSVAPENNIVSLDNDSVSPDNDSAPLDNDPVSFNINSMSNSDSASPENDSVPPENYSVPPDNDPASLDIKSVSNSDSAPPDNHPVSLYMNTVSNNDSVPPGNDSLCQDNVSAPPENDSVHSEINSVPPDNYSISLDINSVSSNRKIMVVTVLGVQSTGKSTLLNTMFGVQFAVSSGRCTRGAFMLLIKINEDMKNILNCDFMLIIDTEGLKSPELAQLDNSYEHDNELATLVVGLSDVTIVNIAMENLTEMKNILQIVVHAFLRMKEVGKKPKCQFVHQNVSDVSAHENNLRDRKLLLEQLNEMTQAAAKMEKKEENKSFTDVMEYSPDTGTWYIPGLWNGNPPMAPVNAGYSEAVYELRKNIIQLLGNCESSANDIMEFKEWVKSLWNAVKHENFIFSFRNSLIADAYMKLCTEFNEWEWKFKKEMYTWVRKAETTIHNFGTITVKSETSDMREFLRSLKSEVSTVLSAWETKLLDNLTQYFEQSEGHVYLVEGYKEEFLNSGKILCNEMENSVMYQLEAATENKQGMTEIIQIKNNNRNKIEKAVRALIDECRKKNIQTTDAELDKEFERMWSETLEKLSFSEQKSKNVTDSVSCCLRENLTHRGRHANELLSEMSLQSFGKESFKYTAEGWYNKIKHGTKKWLTGQDHIKDLADSIIDLCTDFVNEQVKRKNNYRDTYIQEILHMIDEKLQNNRDVKINIEFEVSLKQHICGFAARQFQKMHEDFIEENDPYRCLIKSKERFRDDFKDVFHEQDQCQKKAEEFTNRCLKPAVEDYIIWSLGPDIIDEMRKLEQFSTRMSFQYSILLDLLSKEDFQNYLSYICSYEKYVKTWILDQIKERFSNQSSVFESEERHLRSCIDSINSAINKAKTRESDDLKAFVEDICKELGDKMVISQDALGAFMILNNADKEQFADWLTVSVNDMTETLRNNFKQSNFEMKLEHLHLNPQNELFSQLIGCGKQCPFCKAPCDAGGKAHTEHFASLHRPEGLGRYRWESTKKLDTEICSSLVISDDSFHCSDTNNEWHPYKNYKEIYKDWNIQPDMSLDASNYWKYVMTAYNSDFAKEYKAETAEIPEAWKELNKEKAEKSLKESFYIK
ncbi:uncharacterized protein LOC120722409 isoform X2 [Simochromis diagramma]|uniref:uncharacterized protein LOC120722409 isoform X2 n=1 Tax=Simochromis diagramma TaxID=43689 RepID=UPI001A7ED1E0|nr:uncharacterized protein LOC120722409 isoform X2 [Simochromis diagramma]